MSEKSERYNREKAPPRTLRTARDRHGSLDTLNVEQRSVRMGLVRDRDTRPELLVRRMAHGLGFRYRLRGCGLPGRPDLVFRRHKSVIFVHGCFWHRHPGCGLARFPKSPERAEFWRRKLLENARRDRRNLRTLRHTGWRVLVVWECQTRSSAILSLRLLRFLNPPRLGSGTG